MHDVLILCEYATLNGGERSMLSTLPHVISAGYCVRVAAPAEGDLNSKLRRCDVEHVPFDLCDAAGKRVDQRAAREQIRQVLRDVKPCLVHANSLSMSRLIGPVASEEGMPSIGHLRDIIRVSRKAMTDLNQNTRLIAVSHATRDYHVANGMDAARTHVVYNGVDLAARSCDAQSDSLRKELEISDDSLLVATIGQTIARKGTDLFVEAAVAITQRQSNAHFLVIGECYSRKAESQQFVADLHKTVDKHKARSNLHFLGYRSDIDNLFSQIDLVVQPARQDPLCRVLLEAAAAGRAIIASDVGGTREIFPSDSDAAIIVEPNNVVALSEAIESLLNDVLRRQELGNNAQLRAETAFGVRRAVAELVRHYEDILTNQLRSSPPPSV